MKIESSTKHNEGPPKAAFRQVFKWVGITIMFVVSFMTASAQTTVSGTVKDGDQALPGVNVVVKGSTKGTSTDADGRYKITVGDPSSVLVFSFIGYSPEEQTVGNRTVIDVAMIPDIQSLQEVVVVGYGTQNRRTVTGAVSSVKASDLQTVNAVSVDNLLQGKAAGLSISQRSAQPGGGLNISIRGQLSPRGGNEPLYVIDGVPITSTNGTNASKIGPGNNNFSEGADRSPLATINPSDIESIDILKDASATAIYGSAAANGVILITTKKGKEGAAVVNYNGSYSIQKIYKYWDMLNATEYMQQANFASKERWMFEKRIFPYGNTDPGSVGGTYVTPFSDEAIANAKNYNASDEIMRTGKINDHNVSISGGTANTKYFTSFNYFDQASLLRTTNFKRMSGRINLEQKVNKWLKLNLNTTYSSIVANNPSIGGQRSNGNEARQTNAALMWSPQKPLVDEDGNLTTHDNPKNPNPYSWLLIEDKSSTQRLLFAPNLEAKISNSLKANVVLGIDRTTSERDVFSPTKAKLPEQTQNNYGGFANNVNNNSSVEGYLSYDKEFGQHQLSVVLGGGYYNTNEHSHRLTVFNIPTDALSNDLLDIASDKELNDYGSYRSERTKLSQFGRLNYTFKDRYILGFTARNDGSSVFAEGNKWGFFPGVSAAWIVSEEAFLANVTPLTNLKLRVGYGETGNESVLTRNFYTKNLYGSAYGYNYYIGGQLFTGILQSQLGNPNLTWETDATTNIGMDVGLFNNKVTATLEVYRRTAKDLLDFTPLPSNSSISQIAKNVGSTRSDGFEIELRGQIIKTAKVDLRVNANFSKNKSYWVERNPEVALNPWIGERDRLNTIYGWKSDGLFQSVEEVQGYTSNGKVLQPGSFPGMLKYIDQNNDGVLNGDDVVKLGNYDPTSNIGFGVYLRYGGFDINVNSYGMFGMSTYNGWMSYTSLYSLDLKQNQSTHVYDIWSSENPGGTLPGVAFGPTESNNPSGVTDGGTLQKTNFIRLKNVTLGYNLPNDLLTKTRVARSARVYIDMQNLFVFTNYVGLDPEMERNASPFPIPFTVAMGVNISF